MVIRLGGDRGLWVHAPPAPTEEFFRLVESLGVMRHVVVPTYALEHKIQDLCEECDGTMARGDVVNFSRAVHVSGEECVG